ncbi:BSD domain-containing protein 1-A-like isoform X2 [Cimex lectularius]|uniref:BSD domain-containing protein n=1 Tax=Cimex lectularius TaxID=79782 RepID=A0A8I6SFF8_CIMLE|nr:BSD domain-containing protein 1-A-like isoform X2 [Cimex lectularius]
MWIQNLDKEDSTATSVKKSLSSFLDQISDVFVPPSEDDQVYVPLVVKDGEPVQLSPIQMKLYTLISSEGTYTTPIELEFKDRFEAWLKVSEEIFTNVKYLSISLASNSKLQDKYTQLVPDKVSHSDFWKRYLFRKALLEDTEAERERKEARRGEEEIEKEKEICNEDDILNDIDFRANVELTEEEQTQLLAQYEAEIKNEFDVSTIRTREKKDLVIVGSNLTSQASTSSKESSTDGEWEKEFELEDEKN